MTIHLPPHIERSIQDAVQRGHFASVDDAMTEAASLLLERLKHEQARPPAARPPEAAQAHKPIWEVIEEENCLIPPEVWDALPPDLSEQHDHYIYGVRRKA